MGIDGTKDAYEAFKNIGGELKCLDHKDSEFNVNLNDGTWVGQYHLVLDHGTLEHCSRFSTALETAVNSVEVGGYIIHTDPINMINHGYFGINPIFWRDFYIQENGFELKSLRCILPDFTYAAINFGHKDWSCPRDACCQVLAKRVTHCAIKWPIQGRYR